MCYIVDVNNLQKEIYQTKKLYRDVFNKVKEALDSQIASLKSSSLCNHCKQDCDIDFNKIDIFQEFPKGCRYRFWQESVLDLLENRISKDILDKVSLIEKRRQCFSCKMCSSCCKFATSEYSYDELKKRAQDGDRFSKDFVSVFVPYKNVDEAREIYPEYVDMLEDTFGNLSGIYFYHCPKLSDDGLCSDYENRPSICRDFPNNPLVVLPPKCSFNDWKQEVEITSLMLNAMIDIIGFYKDKLKNLI